MAAAPELGTLRIEADVPNAQVFLDRQFIGNAPVTAENGIACVDVARPFTLAVATGRDQVGAASPFVFASVNYSPDSGGIDCPNGSCRARLKKG